MNRTLHKLLVADVIVRLIGVTGFTIFLGAVYNRTGHASDIGWVSLATALPSLLALTNANACVRRFSAIGVLRGVAILRVLAFGLLICLPATLSLIMVAAGLHSLSHQIAVTSKMTLDAQVLTDAHRRRYLVRKAMLNNISNICAPACGGLLVGFLGYKAALVGLIGANAFLALIVLTVPAPTSVEVGTKPVLAGFGAALRELLRTREVAAVVGVYCAMAAVFEIQSPLVFPFVHEVYGGGSAVAGTLLGLGGLGGLLGALAAEKWANRFSASSIPVLLLLDGLLFFSFTQTTHLPVACVMFVFLGVMGCITLIVVESVVQTRAHPDNHPFIFSMMQFSGGAGGASLGVAAARLAEKYTTSSVLSAAALLEIVVGGLCLVLLGGALRVASTARRVED